MSSIHFIAPKTESTKSNQSQSPSVNKRPDHYPSRNFHFDRMKVNDRTLQTMTTKGDSKLEASGDQKRWFYNPFVKKDLLPALRDMTIHGVPHSARQERAVWSRALWALVVSISMGTFLVMFYDLTIAYYDYPYKTVIEATPVDKLPFPAVSICNINSMDISNVSYAEHLLTIFAKTALETADTETDKMGDLGQVYNMSAQKILEETNPGIDGFFRLCFYGDTARNCSELFNVNYWALTRCYTLNTSQLHPASDSTSLSVIVNINQDGYILQEEKSAGVKFFIHGKDSLPNLDAKSYTAAPGFSTHVGMQFKQLTMLDYPHKSFGGRYCIKVVNFNISGSSVGIPYRLISCLKEHVRLLAQDTCRCILPFQLNATWPVCTLHQMLNCVIPILDILKGNQLNASDTLRCPLPCEHITYSPLITFSYFPSAIMERELRKRTVPGGAYPVRYNYLELNFYYSDLIEHKTTHVPEFTSMSILGTVGGNLGLFLGASLLSLAEVLELVVALVVSILKRLSSARRV